MCSQRLRFCWDVVFIAIECVSGEIYGCMLVCVLCFFFFQAEDGIRDLVRSRGLRDVYKRQRLAFFPEFPAFAGGQRVVQLAVDGRGDQIDAVDLSLIHI